MAQVDRCEAQITHLEEQFRKVGEHSEMFAESVRHRMKVHELLAVDAKRENEFLQSRNRQLEGLLEEAVKKAEGEGEKKSTSRLVEAAEERLQVIRNLQPSTLNPRPSILNPQSSTLNPRSSTLSVCRQWLGC
jgi:hypothetical protein